MKTPNLLLKPRIPLLFMLLLCAAVASSQNLHAATIHVTNTNDSGTGSLREALAAASNGDTIDFSVTTPATITLTSDELEVSSNVTISGPGADQLSVSGNGFRVFFINAGLNVTISGLTITDGNADAGGGIYNLGAALTVSNCTLSNNSSTVQFAGEGGGIFNDQGALTVSNCTVSDNSANDGGGIYNSGFEGSASLTINNSTISDNSALVGVGGGIENDGSANSGFEGSAALTINNSTISDNSAIFGGGGIENDGFLGSATLTINNSTLNGNSASDPASNGGGIYNNGSGDGTSNYRPTGRATLTIKNSTLNGNSATSTGGGIYNDGTQTGAATLTIVNSTVSGNSVDSYGGGIYSRADFGSAILTIINSTLSNNSASLGGGGIYNGVNATLTLGNTILKTGASGENIFNFDGPVISLGYNLSNDNGGGFLTATGDQINTDPVLGPLQNNGGSTFTHELLTGSPAIDAGGPEFDQRGLGFLRVAGGRIDIGAVEFQATPPTPTPTPTPTATPTATPTHTPPPHPTPRPH
jgi:hypothetical protein